MLEYLCKPTECFDELSEHASKVAGTQSLSLCAHCLAPMSSVRLFSPNLGGSHRDTQAACVTASHAPDSAASGSPQAAVFLMIVWYAILCGVAFAHEAY